MRKVLIHGLTNVIDLSLENTRELLNQAYQEMMNMEISDQDNPDLARKRQKWIR